MPVDDMQEYFSPRNSETHGKASFMRGPNYVQKSHQESVRGIIDSCNTHSKESNIAKILLQDLVEENNLKQDGFQAIHNILHSLEENESKVLETLFFYKVNDINQFNVEAAQVIKDYKVGKLDPNNRKAA